MFKNFRLVWADKLALLLACFIAGTAFLFWISGTVGLEGYSNPRFDGAMIDWTLKAELLLVPPMWLLLRVIDIGAKALARVLRSSLGRVRPVELRLPSYTNAGIRA